MPSKVYPVTASNGLIRLCTGYHSLNPFTYDKQHPKSRKTIVCDRMLSGCENEVYIDRALLHQCRKRQ